MRMPESDPARHRVIRKANHVTNAGFFISHPCSAIQILRQFGSGRLQNILRCREAASAGAINQGCYLTQQVRPFCVLSCLHVSR